MTVHLEKEDAPWPARTTGNTPTHYHDSRLEYCTEVIFDCMSGGVPHKHAMDQMIARKV